jgi:hypothetical protein
MSKETAYGMLKDLNEREGFKEDLGTCLTFSSSFLNKGFRIITVIYDDVYILYMHDGEFWFMVGNWERFLKGRERSLDELLAIASFEARAR